MIPSTLKKGTFGFAMLLLLAACGAKQEKENMPSATDAIPVKIMSLAKGDHASTIETSGQFTTDDEALLSFKTGGIVNAVLVKEGEHIHPGQLLATLDLTEIEAQVQQAQLGFEKAQRDYKRVENLYKDSVVTLEHMQNSKTQMDLAQQQLTAAKFNLNYSGIRATKEGYVLKKFVNPGQLVGAGSPVLQTNGAGKSKWILKAGVSDKEWARIAVQDSVTVVTDAREDLVLKGKVSSKSEGADPVSGSFVVEIEITNPAGCQLAAGMFGKASIHASAHASAWEIPYDALLDGNMNSGFVFVTEDGKTAKKIPVTIGAINHNSLLISKGLEGQDKLIVSGNAYLSNNSAIVIVK